VACFPDIWRARARPSSDPIASPSGFAWLVRSTEREAATSDCSSSGINGWVSCAQFLEQSVDVLAVLGAAIEMKAELRSDPQIEAAGNLATEESGSMLKSRDGGLAVGIRTEDRNPHVGQAEVGRDLDFRHGSQLDSRIAELSQQQL
jgi:agmatine/peptidylarginine deiminase